MLFFYALISEFNKGYANLFGEKDEEGDEEDDTGGEGENTRGHRPPEQGNQFGEKWGWIYFVDRVSETSREPWSVVYQMNPYEFFNILSYRKDKDAEEKRVMDEWKRKH